MRSVKFRMNRTKTAGHRAPAPVGKEQPGRRDEIPVETLHQSEKRHRQYDSHRPRRAEQPFERNSRRKSLPKQALPWSREGHSADRQHVKARADEQRHHDRAKKTLPAKSRG